VGDIERTAPNEKKELMGEVERICSLAKQLNIPMVQLTTGPLNIGLGLPAPPSYGDIVKLPWPELRSLTANNVKEISDIGAKYGVVFYMEALAWTPTHTLDQALEILDVVQRDNVKLILDFWHLFATGSTPDDIVKKVKKEIIGGVHLCDSLKGDGSDHEDRNVWTGGGVIPLQEWTDAIKATGFDGWWAGEMFSHKHRELDQWQVAQAIRELMYMLIV
jgi:sugar phosphate isomerase/epimerase